MERSTPGGAPGQEGLDWTRYAWLVYLPAFLVAPGICLLAGRLSAAEGAATALAVALFLVSYFRGFRARGAELLLVVALHTLLGAAFVPRNVGASVFFIYAASFAGRLEGTRRAAQLIAAVAAVALAALWMAGTPPYIVACMVVLAALIGGVNVQHARVGRAHDRLRVAHERIGQLAAVAERERIARDLHDLLGHTLSLVVLKSELAGKLVPRDPERAQREIRDVERVARQALQEVRETIRGYRPSLAEEADRSRSLLGAAGIRGEIDVAPSPSLGEAAAETLAFALREAVTNVVRHSGASSCRARLHASGAHATLEVEDDGRWGDGPEGSGLRGMRERVEALGGTVTRRPGASGRGTRLEVRVP